jgi:hypothetical protein
LDRLELVLGRVVCRRHLVERVLRVLLELLPYLVDLLVPAQTLLVLHLLESSLLILSICSLESSFGVAVELVLLFGGQVESVEGVVDTGGVESTGLCVEGSESGVDATRLLLGLGSLALGLGRQRGLLFAQESFFLGLLARGFGGLLSSSFPVEKSVFALLP